MNNTSIECTEFTKQRIAERNALAKAIFANAFNGSPDFAIKRANEMMVKLYGENWEMEE